MKPKPKTKPPANRKRDVAAFTLPPGSIVKLRQLTERYGKSYDSHTVEKIIDDTYEREFGGNWASNAPGRIARGTGPEPISLNDAPLPTPGSYPTKGQR